LQSVTFNSLSSADTYFTDNSIDLGSITGLTSIAFQLNVTTTVPGDSFDAALIFGDATANAGPVPTPEPGGAAPVGLLAAMALARWRRRCPRDKGILL
jgi:MYXO-CTERM domain-containing protein